MNIQKMNFEDLRGSGEGAPSFEVPFKLLKTYPAAQLRTLLRHHDEESVEGEDTERRDAFDELLAYYSRMEVAAIAGYIPKRLPDDYSRTALAALTKAPVRTYYEKKYPLLLPTAHRERLSGNWAGREKDPEAAPLFASFAELNRTVDDDDDVETLLWFLEDGSVGRYSLENLLAIVSDPHRFASAIAPAEAETACDEELWSAIQVTGALNDPGKLARRFAKKERRKNPVDRALRGFRKFLFFCRDFDRLLMRAASYRLLQSAMWHYHAYWFDELSDELRPYMTAAINRFAAWDVAPEEAHNWIDDRTALIEETRRMRAAAVAEMQDVVARLTSGEYGLAMRERFESSVARARAHAARIRPIAPVSAVGARTVARATAAAAEATSAEGRRQQRSGSRRAASTKEQPNRSGAKAAAAKRAKSKRETGGKKTARSGAASPPKTPETSKKAGGVRTSIRTGRSGGKGGGERPR